MTQRVLMLSGDRTVFDPSSAVRARLRRYAARVEQLTVLVTGMGDARKEVQGNLSLQFPGGRSRFDNFFRMAKAARTESRSASIVTTQDPYVTGLVGLYASWGRAPLQVQVHGALFTSAFTLESFRHVVESVIAVGVLPLASCVRAVSEKTASAARAVTRAPVTVLPVSVDRTPFENIGAKPSEYGEHPVILAVSRLSHEKNIPLMLRAFARTSREAHLYIAGEGPERARLESLAGELSISDRVHFLGWKNEIAPYFFHASCVVHTALYESYCLTLVEAVLARVPVVTTDVGVARELSEKTVTIVAATEAAVSGALTQALLSPPPSVARDEARAALFGTLLTEEETAERFVALWKTCGSA